MVNKSTANKLFAIAMAIYIGAIGIAVTATPIQAAGFMSNRGGSNKSHMKAIRKMFSKR